MPVAVKLVTGLGQAEALSQHRRVSEPWSRGAALASLAVVAAAVRPLPLMW